MKTEKHLFNYMKKACKPDIGCFKLHCESMTGWPDLMLICDGRVVLVELKTPAGTGRLSHRQKLVIQQLANHGAEVYVIDSKEQADKIIEEITRPRAERGHRSLI
jgi:hypothetical protein